MDFTELNFSDFEFSKIIDALDLLVNPLFKLIVYLSVLSSFLRFFLPIDCSTK